MLVASLLIVLFATFRVARSGYPSFLCSASETNNQTFFPCDADCFYQHGAEHGICGPLAQGDYNCYCGRQHKHRVEESLHCIAREGKFKQLCVVDCQCNHGAQTGICDFDRKRCKCVGRDPHNKRCQFDTVKEFAEFTAGIVPDDSPAWLYLQYFVERKAATCDVAKAEPSTASPSATTTSSTTPPTSAGTTSTKVTRETHSSEESAEDSSTHESSEEIEVVEMAGLSLVGRIGSGGDDDREERGSGSNFKFIRARVTPST